MNERSFRDIGKQFYEWHKDDKIRFEYAGHSKNLELEVERIMGLIDYAKNKKQHFSNPGSRK